MSALPASELGSREARRVTVRAATGLVAGLTSVFQGVATGLAGSFLLRHQVLVVRGFGVVVIVLGSSTVAVLRVPMLYRERRSGLARAPRAPGWSVPMGMAPRRVGRRAGGRS